MARFDSSISTRWTLRARRRAGASGRPAASVIGNTVTLSAPPQPAAKVAAVARIALVQGSRRVIIRHDVSA